MTALGTTSGGLAVLYDVSSMYHKLENLDKRVETATSR